MSMFLFVIISSLFSSTIIQKADAFNIGIPDIPFFNFNLGGEDNFDSSTADDDPKSIDTEKISELFGIEDNNYNGNNNDNNINFNENDYSIVKPSASTMVEVGDAKVLGANEQEEEGIGKGEGRANESEQQQSATDEEGKNSINEGSNDGSLPFPSNIIDNIFQQNEGITQVSNIQDSFPSIDTYSDFPLGLLEQTVDCW